MANEYISPTGFNDPNGSWVGETNAYDNNLMTKASTSIPAKSWSNYIELTIDLIYCSKIKFYAAYNGTGGINSIDIDVWYSYPGGGGSWHDVYQGSFLSFVWVEKDFGDHPSLTVTKMRMRFYNNSSEMYIATLVEAMFYKIIGVPSVETNAATSVEDDEATLNGNITSTGGEAPT
ncbi:MAG TPA: hypothetical protein VMV86_04930, partial [Methanosarcinales archaeon]|nr:hypothetical protein [Methanosarcinales archaeon]